MKKLRIGLLTIATLWTLAQNVSVAQTSRKAKPPDGGENQPTNRSPRSATLKAKQAVGEGSQPGTTQQHPLSPQVNQTESIASRSDRPEQLASSIASPDLDKRLDTLQASVDHANGALESSRFWSSRDIAYIVTAIAAVGGLLISALALKTNLNLSLTQLRQNVRNEKAKALQTKLDQFYGPLLHLRSTSALLYQIFGDRQQNPDDFRTLTALLSGMEFKGNDSVLLEEIIKIGEETEQLILKSSALVDEDLQSVLGRALTHYRILRLAHKGMLKGEPDKFSAHVYPRDLDEAINRKVSQIRQAVEELSTIELQDLPTV
jgi:hypothetical protein